MRARMRLGTFARLVRTLGRRQCYVNVCGCDTGWHWLTLGDLGGGSQLCQWQGSIYSTGLASTTHFQPSSIFLSLRAKSEIFPPTVSVRFMICSPIGRVRGMGLLYCDIMTWPRERDDRQAWLYDSSHDVTIYTHSYPIPQTYLSRPTSTNNFPIIIIMII